MEALRNKRRGLKSRLTCAIRRLKTSEMTEVRVNIVIEHLDGIWKDMLELQDQMLTIAREDELEEIIEQFNDEEDRITEARDDLLELKTTFARTPIEKPVMISPGSVEVRLPPLNLPSFGGDPTDWTTFFDLFKASVDNNVSLSNAQKLQYLKSSLHGEAARLLKHIAITEANYSEAIELLQKRYDNKREIANSLIQKIIKLPSLKEKSLREVLDRFYEADRALKAVTTDEIRWDLIVSNIILNSIDNETLRNWELSLPHTEIPRLEELLNFLEIRARAVGNSVLIKGESSKNLPFKQVKCPECKEPHSIRLCKKFEKATVDQRRQLVVKHKLCFNCLSPGHSATDCRSSKCRKCQKNHNTMLHFEGYNEGKTNLATWVRDKEVLLPTVKVQVNHGGKIHTLRALLDSGSQVNLISNRAQQNLGLKKSTASKVAHSISGKCPLSAEVTMTIGKEDWKQRIRCFVVKDFNIVIPSKQLEQHHWNHIDGLDLADPEFYIPKKIDLLLGMNICSQLIMEGLKKGNENEPIAQRTRLGWTIGGSVTEKARNPASLFCKVDNSLKRFWELEEIPNSPIFTEEEAKVEEKYEKSTSRLRDGTYQVLYPFSENPPQLGTSKPQAITRFLRLEHQLRKKNIFSDYKDVIEEYQNLGHMVPISKEDQNKPSYYLPHHAVFKESTTTKIRVVFDASAETSNGKSLNALMENGPKTQEDIFYILVRFQSHAFAICADVEKMYRQIKIDPIQQNYQRILWRESLKENIKEFKLTTLTFGMKAAPYLATKTLQKLAHDEGRNYPIAKEIVLRDFYVDDLLTGANSQSEAIQLCTQVNNLLRAGGFNLRKWCSNNASIIQNFTTKAQPEDVIIAENESIKTLGLQWNPKKDVFGFSVKMPFRKKHTKRSLLSDTSRIFDPLGWLSPVIIVAKIMFQELWRSPITWDQELPPELLQKWINYRDNLVQLQKIEIQRYLPYKRDSDLSLCGFCDASEKGYGAVIYLRSESEGKIKTKLLASKSKVAPLKTLTIPRLELCAAVLLTKLARETAIALRKNIPTMFWTDSSVVLHWIHQQPSRWKTFVAHRVAEIQENSEPSHWYHVPTNENPADLISRGLSPEVLQTSTLWWEGPAWLKQTDLPKRMVPLTKTAPEAKKIKPVILTTIQNQENFIEKFSSLDKLLRITAYMKRFINKAQRKTSLQGPLKVWELNLALRSIIKGVQNKHFLKEIRDLSKKKEIQNKSKILSLAPFIDSEGILRVGGRLQNAKLMFDQKHQLLLPSDDHLTKLILDDAHKKNLHAGPQLLLNTIRQKYWIPRARNIIRSFIHKCVTCIRQKANFSKQIMGDLPEYRVSPSRPFLKCGVDYCGPITCKEMVGRSKKYHKAFGAVFVCMATKAVHLELVSNLSMEAFMLALHRFVSRRGLPSDIYSDNGRNFVGANRYLKEVHQMLREEANKESLNRMLSAKGIQWHFIPPYSPHFGGLWEAGVKSLKFHLRRIVGPNILTFEELTTVLNRIEACLNSRPICPLSMDAEDLEALTPGHFLIGAALNTIPEENVKAQTPTNRLSRYRLLQKITQDVWKRWQQDYLNNLQSRYKWQTRSSNPIKIGDLVIIKDTNLQPQHWQLGRVQSVSKDAAGDTRVVTLKTFKGTTTRAITQVIRLLPEDICENPKDNE